MKNWDIKKECKKQEKPQKSFSCFFDEQSIVCFPLSAGEALLCGQKCPKTHRRDVRSATRNRQFLKIVAVVIHELIVLTPKITHQQSAVSNQTSLLLVFLDILCMGFVRQIKDLDSSTSNGK